MGRARITLTHIQNQRARKTTFMQRSKGLMKKISEFSTMCGVEVCLIAYDGNGDAGPVTWPSNPTVLHSILEKYERQKNEKPPTTFGLEDFFEHRKDMVEAEISKVQKEILKIKYPTWNPCFNNMGQEQLQAFIAALDAKIGACDDKINMLKNKQPSEASFNLMQKMAQPIVASPNLNQLSMQTISQSQHIPAPTKPHKDNNGIVDFTNQVDVQNMYEGSQYQILNFNPNVMQLMAKNNWMVDLTNQVDVSVDRTTQIGAFGNPTNNLDVPLLMAKNSEMVDITNQVDVPVDCTKQIGAFGNSTNQLDVPEYWTSQLGEAEDWVSQPDVCINWVSQPDVPVTGTNHISNATAMIGASNYGTNFHALQKDGNEDKTVSSLCNYNGGAQSMQLCNFDPAMQNIASQFGNVQQGAALHTLPPLVDKFNTKDYSNMLQAELLKHIN